MLDSDHQQKHERPHSTSTDLSRPVFPGLQSVSPTHREPTGTDHFENLIQHEKISLFMAGSPTDFLYVDHFFRTNDVS